MGSSPCGISDAHDTKARGFELAILGGKGSGEIRESRMMSSQLVMTRRMILVKWAFEASPGVRRRSKGKSNVKEIKNKSIQRMFEASSCEEENTKKVDRGRKSRHHPTLSSQKPRRKWGGRKEERRTRGSTRRKQAKQPRTDQGGKTMHGASRHRGGGGRGGKRHGRSGSGPCQGPAISCEGLRVWVKDQWAAGLWLEKEARPGICAGTPC